MEPLQFDDSPVDPRLRSCLLLYEEDLSLDMVLSDDFNVAVVLEVPPLMSDVASSLNSRVMSFKEAATRDASSRLLAKYPEACQLRLDSPDISVLLVQNEIEQLLYARPAVGPWKKSVCKWSEQATSLKVSCAEICRQWDKEFFPYATAGFFKFKRYIKDTLHTLGLLEQ